MKKIKNYNYEDLLEMNIDNLFNIISKNKMTITYFNWFELREVLIRIIVEYYEKEDEKDD